MNDISQSPDSVAAAQRALGTAYRDIAVHLDGSPEDEARLAQAEALAARFPARITGIFTNLLPDPALFAGDFGMTAIGQLTDAMIEEGNAVEARLRQRLARLGAVHELRRLDAFPGFMEQAVATEARWNDLFVATCPRDGDPARWRAMIEGVMFEGGRGLYLLPPAAELRSAIRTVLVGWVDARQSARAVAEAMPLILQASQIHVVTVREEAHGRMGGAEILADITAHLARYGVKATANVLNTDTTAADALLAEADKVSADLIVAGAYGHSRFREWVLGGATEDLLMAAPVPLLLAH
ncbi:universal stress protein [Bosea sp. CS1GBMeth4]|uniref:universal stress protein n=1 Tax=Bosea sp. CS1GBMeth4 TaxID=1892849 RepID=UPI0016464ADE|nr:universal stress protein [Bosea sp. CS1GBMeth4]